MRTLMVQGTMSSAGKSLLTTALCRIFARQGVKVAPFKAQNMSNNAAVCADGGEIGRAQFTQALACGIEPTVQMNPVLLKPEADARSQVVLNGRVHQTLPARDYYARRDFLWGHVTAAYDALHAAYDLVIVEGAGSPAELNLKRNDIVNMAVATYAKAAVLLAGDIDRGGIFAQLLGTLWLLPNDERALVKGLLVNKFRGDPTLFEDGVAILEARGGVPVLGVIPYIHDHRLPEEDAVAVEEASRNATDGIDIAVIRLPRIANFDDYDPLAHEPGVSIRYVTTPAELGTPHAIVIPGTKSTMADLSWLRARGLHTAIQHLAENGTAVVGVCGGYQMLGVRVNDPAHVESDVSSAAGLGLLPVETTFEAEKSTRQARAEIIGGAGWLASLHGETIGGYEIHMGQTPTTAPLLQFEDRADGASAFEGRVWGCYLHGLFGNEAFRRVWLRSLGWARTDETQGENPFDRVADAVENAIDMARLWQIVGEL